MTDFETLVLGGGAVGLATARSLALRGHQVTVLERQRYVGTETSSRNSGVIHAGIYYRPSTLKARLCVAGKTMLYAYCQANGVEHRRTGKLVVATRDDEVAALSRIKANAQANGVLDLTLLNRDAARTMEPDLSCVAALYSPSTGIVDAHGYMQALEGEIGSLGGQIVVGQGVASLSPLSNGFALALEGSDVVVTTRNLVVCAGLHTTKLMVGLENSRYRAPPTIFAKGNYFSLDCRSPFSRLIYPVPEPGGLGVHLTLDLESRARFGPDVQWVDEIDYSVDGERSKDFYAHIRKYWPNLPDGALKADYCGIRPKLNGPGGVDGDFVIHGQEDHGYARLVALFGIESPGLTASLAIGDRVATIMGDYLD